MSKKPLSLLAILVALLALGAAATSATADRAATTQEAQEVAAAAKSDPECVTVRISTTDESYAELYDARNPDCNGGDGFVVFHRSGGVWKDVFANSGQVGCPKELPQAVSIDFKICTRPSRRVYFARFGKLVYKPRNLPQGAHGEYQRLHWKGWNTATAVGTGILYYDDAYDTFRLKVRVTLSRRGTCGNKRAYQRITDRVLTGPAEVRKNLSTTINDYGCTGGA